MKFILTQSHKINLKNCLNKVYLHCTIKSHCIVCYKCESQVEMMKPFNKEGVETTRLS